MKPIFFMTLFVLTICSYGKNFSPKLTIIAGTAALLKDGDTVTMILEKYGNFYSEQALHQTYTTRIKNGSYKFSFSISIPAYFTITQRLADPKYNYIRYLIQPGDNVSLNRINADSIKFGGKGMNRLRVQYENRKIISRWLRRTVSWDTSGIVSSFKTLDSGFVKQIEYLSFHKEIIGNTAYNILIADVLGDAGLKMEYRLIGYDPSPYYTTWRKALLDYKNEFWHKYNRFVIRNPFVNYSYMYANALIAIYKWDSCVVPQKKFNIRSCYDYFKLHLKGSLREKVITTLLYDNNSRIEDVSWCLQTALHYTSNSDFRRLLLKMKKNLVNGSTAYQFNLPDENGIRHDYSTFQGKVVILDFWFTGCIGCLRIKPKVDSIIELFPTSQIVLVSISVDKDRQTWLNSLKKQIYTSGRSINLFTEGKGVEHPIISHYLIRGYPALLITDKQCKLLGIPVNPLIDGGESFVKLIDKALNK